MASRPEPPRSLIGRRPEVAGLAEHPGLRACHGPGWTLAANLAFLDDLAQAPVALASRPPEATPGPPASFFAWEWGWLGLLGRAPVPPGWEAWASPRDPVLETLARDPGSFLADLRARAASGDTRIPGFGPLVARMAWAAWMVDPALVTEGLDLLGLGTPYGPTLRYALAFVARLDALARETDPSLPVVFEPKVRGEFEALLGLFPHLVAVPTFARLDREALVRLRKLPVHPLGLFLGPRVLDGARRSPLEAFLHDLDHARYKVREDLARRGVPVTDPYQLRPGCDRADTLEDPARGRHRTVLDAVDPREAARLEPGPEPDPEPQVEAILATWRPELRAAAGLLRFELHHEKSLPRGFATLAQEAGRPVHHARLQAKLVSGFLGGAPCDPAWLEPAGLALARLAARRLAS
ncbi:MAG: hypothetical protein U0P81_09955 [Holophagaceae bacterium]